MEISPETFVGSGFIDKMSYAPKLNHIKICTYIESPPMLNLVESDDDEIYSTFSQPPPRNLFNMNDDLTGEKSQYHASPISKMSLVCDQPSMPSSNDIEINSPTELVNSNKSLNLMQKNAASFPCLLCNRTFCEKRSRNVHLGKAHALQKTYNDALVLKRMKLAKLNNLRNLDLNSFTPEPSSTYSKWILQCGMCSKTFFKPLLLHEHTLAEHNGVRIVIKMPWEEKTTTDKSSPQRSLPSPKQLPPSPTQKAPILSSSQTPPPSFDRCKSGLVHIAPKPNSAEVNSATKRNSKRTSPSKLSRPQLSPQFFHQNGSQNPLPLNPASQQNTKFVPVLGDSLKLRLYCIRMGTNPETSSKSQAVEQTNEKSFNATNTKIIYSDFNHEDSHDSSVTVVSPTNTSNTASERQPQNDSNDDESGTFQTYQAETIVTDGGGLKLRISQKSRLDNLAFANFSPPIISSKVPVMRKMLIDLEEQTDNEEADDNAFRFEVGNSNENSNRACRKRRISDKSGSISRSDQSDSGLAANSISKFRRTKRTRKAVMESSSEDTLPNCIDLRSNQRCRQVLSDNTARATLTNTENSTSTFVLHIRQELSKLPNMSSHEAIQIISTLKAEIAAMNDPEFVQMLKTFLRFEQTEEVR